jgi:hypothetical protein
MAVAAAVLGPLLRPGYPLRFDLVTVPRPVLGDDALGLGDRLPRAIPLDGATAALAAVLPDALVTQLLALLALTLAGWGAARLTPASLPARLAAAVVAVWNPFVLEQLAIGHVPHLFGYGALPWAGLHAYALARGPGGRWASLRAWAGLTGAVGLGSLTPGGGALCAVAAVAGLAGGAARARRAGTTPAKRLGWIGAGLGSVAVLQLPWLLAAMVHPAFAASASGGDGGLTLFELRPETGWGRLVDALGLAGMWNSAALPDSRATVLARASTVLIIVLVLAGLPALRRLARAGAAPEVAAAVAAAATGYLVAVLPILPGGSSLLRFLVDTVPGAGLLRDGHRWLGLTAIGVAVLAGLTTQALGDLAGRWSRRQDVPPTGARAAAAVLVGCLAVATMPDLAGGLAGRLAAREYPADWTAARGVLDAAPDRARVLILPWGAFRRFAWTGPDAVLDPAPRLLPRQVVVSDALAVGGERVPEEGLGARAVAAALTDDRLDDAELRDIHVGWVLIEHGTPGGLPQLPADWRPAFEGAELTLLRAPEPVPAAPRPTTFRLAAVLGAHLAAVLLLGAAAAAMSGNAISARRKQRSVR